MERREALRYTALLTGAALGAPLVSAVMSGCGQDSGSMDVGDLKFFPKSEFELLQMVADVILPSTESPSASDVGVPLVIDHMVGHVYSEEDRKKFREGFKAFSTHLREIDFKGMDIADKEDTLRALGSDEEGDLHDIYLDIRQQAIAYYLSSQVVSTEFLNFLPVPGEYEPCVDLADVGGKAWAIL